uniref:Uncharacterized protein n=1 Tax=Anguilla anguilla TaxID=7936 RepID=A0A0E9XNS7_ANGAN
MIFNWHEDSLLSINTEMVSHTGIKAANQIYFPNLNKKKKKNKKKVLLALIPLT